MNHVITAYEYLSQGGGIMFPLIFVSLCMWTLITERLLYYKKLRGPDISAEEAVTALRTGEASEVFFGIRAKIVREAIGLSGGYAPDAGEVLLCCRREINRIGKYLPFIASFVAIAPLLGLLGTVVGMVSTFDVISGFGTGNARAMAGGISTALITTQSGLMVAIPGLFLSAFLNRRAARFVGILEELGNAYKRAG